MCEDCKTAAQQVHHGFTFGCQGCCARAAARSQPYRDAQQAGRLTSNYRWLLQQFGLTAGQVSQAAAADKLHQEARA